MYTNFFLDLDLDLDLDFFCNEFFYYLKKRYKLDINPKKYCPQLLNLSETVTRMLNEVRSVQ